VWKDRNTEREIERQREGEKERAGKRMDKFSMTFPYMETQGFYIMMSPSRFLLVAPPDNKTST
jgi:hypothetical protein